MNEREEFLLYLYKTCDMGVSSTTELLRLLNNKENKIKVKIGEELKEYEKYLEKVKAMLDEFNIDYSKNVIAKISSTVSMKFEIMMDNSDEKIADMLIQGYTMGVLEVSKKIKKYKDYVEKEELKIAEDLKKFQNKNIKELKEYL